MPTFVMKWRVSGRVGWYRVQVSRRHGQTYARRIGADGHTRVKPVWVRDRSVIHKLPSRLSHEQARDEAEELFGPAE